MHDTFGLMTRHRGIWEGLYTHLDANTHRIVEQQMFRIRAEYFTHHHPSYRQTSHYWWPDGREQELMYEGSMHGDALQIDNGRIWGHCRAISVDTLYMEFGYTATPDLRIAEMLQLSDDGKHRARTWHWLRSGVLERITLVREQHRSHDPADWPAIQTRPALAFD
jgi:hypothetical protein